MYKPPNFQNWNKAQKQNYWKFVKTIGKGTSNANKPGAVNPNPQPPNANQTQQNNAQAQASTTTTQNAATQNAGQNNNYEPPQGADTPFSSYKPQADKPDPRDTQYWTDVAKLYFDKQNELNTMDYQDRLRGIDYQNAQTDLARQEPRARLAQKVANSRQGNLFSSAADYDQTMLQEDFLRQNTDLVRNYQRDNDARALVRNALEQGYSVNEAAALAYAVDRESQRQANNPPPPGDTSPEPPTQDTGPTLEDILKQFFGNKKPNKNKKPNNKGKNGKKGKK